MKKILFEGMYGLGDNIYQRPFLRYYPNSFIRTPWPELYSDLDIHCVRSETNLRTQRKNEDRTDCEYCVPPNGIPRARIFYGPHELGKGGIIDAFRDQFDVTGPLVFDLPHFEDFHCKIPFNSKIAVLRPGTIRREWASASRNPEPEYLCIAANILRDLGFYVISIADTEPGIEWIVEPAPVADLTLHYGELSITQLCTLFEYADCVVSPVGFSVPMAIAYDTPLFVIAGGRGGHNAPEIVTDPAMVLDNTSWAIPDNYCRCTSSSHNCDKTISDFEELFKEWLGEKVL